MTNARSTALATPRVATTISSRETGRVEPWPSMTLPIESPTRIMSIPA